MAKVIKDIYVTWDFAGDEYALNGFNIAITPSTGDPNNEAVIIEKSGKEKTDVLNSGSSQYEHIFRDVTIDDTKDYIAWVQSIYPNRDSSWVSTSNLTVSDDGTATIATTDADGNPISASAGEVTIDESGVSIVNGAFSIENSDGSMVFDDSQLKITNGNFTLQSSDGLINIDNDGIKSEDADGNYSILDSDQLAFYESGSSTPHWYSKRVAYGTAQDGDNIQLGWDKAPKVQTAIKSLMSYNSAHPDANQVYESYASAITKDNFYVYGRSVSQGAENLFDSNSDFTTEYISTYTSRSNVTKLKIEIGLNYVQQANGVGYALDYQTDSSSSWVNYVSEYLKQSSVTITLSVPSDMYRVRIREVGTSYDWVKLKNAYSYADNVIDNGEVMWIAIEGGA